MSYCLPTALHTDDDSRAVGNLREYYGRDGGRAYTGSYFDGWAATRSPTASPRRTSSRSRSTQRRPRRDGLGPPGLRRHHVDGGKKRNLRPTEPDEQPGAALADSPKG